MNRVKRELRKRGLKTEEDYLCIPFYEKGRSCFEPGYICVEGVHVNSETCTVTTFYNIGDKRQTLKRNGEIETEIIF